ncbi:PSD1 and planctomycete cytochrome C domain-containing protein [Humisphaera borealis]|uniref:PSD1 domain-containing protein n=1 Tax=Humisphaera borealis TaxID=2807512 RepID=A0A7M2X4R0_9BACT|nr:PSD1 and planctomycete cytochrome C domain-containing protein [Humisphaera borealis]QOV91760.1 PSD1 domain-containing protein [Humisphaera borealis]
MSSRQTLTVFAAVVALWVTGGPVAAATQSDAASLDHFERKIRPVLVEHCYKCHSAEAQKNKKLRAELYLDTRAGVLKGGESGPAIVPGKPGESAIIRALQYTDEEMQMPPAGKLPAAVIADFETWIAAGAPDPRDGGVATARKEIDIEAGKAFWAFAPLKDSPPPAVNDAAWPRTPIDRFILSGLETQGIKPNGPATREKLVRRAYLDLTGLPPTADELDEVLADTAADAYDRLIDRLLASPRYGERWGRHWLDVARFGESDGFEHDNARPAAYHYRDFVIRALNEDMPFNRFAALQIAGDEIAPGDYLAMAATGFLTAGVFPTQITEKEFEITRYNQLDDMVSTVGTAMLGLTIGCARCHDHKFDPIGASDYYRLTAAFATAIRSDVDIDLSTDAEKLAAKQAWETRRASAAAKLQQYERDTLPARVKEAVATAARGEIGKAIWSVIDVATATAQSGAMLQRQSDGSFLRTGKPADKDVYRFTTKLPAGTYTAVRVEVMTDPSLPRNGPGTAPNGNFVLSEIELTVDPIDAASKAVTLPLTAARATHQQNKTNLAVAGSIDGKSGTGWAVDSGGIGKAQAAIFDLAKPLAVEKPVSVSFTLRQDNGGKHLIGRPRLAITSEPSPNDFRGEGPDPAVVALLRKVASGAELTADDVSTLREWVASKDASYVALKGELAKLDADGPGIKPVKVQVTSEGLPPVFNHANGRGYPHFYKDVYLLRRGDPANKAEAVSLAFPRVLMRGGATEANWPATPPQGWRTSYRRKAVADWLTDVESGAGHLLARVIVNRLWQHHFGRGLVATPNDFGTQGERPTNPALLDWLATDLIRHGWQLKRVHKLMMTSAVYMQSADTSPDRLAKDPDNRTLWRWSPRRLEAEPIRDSMLAAAGLLDTTMYGPGTLDQSTRRRSVYFMVRRSQLIPMMMVLDWPEPLNSIGARPVTTVAPQALLFMNSPQARQYAEAFATRVQQPTGEATIERAYRTAIGRRPDVAEIKRIVAFLDLQTAAHRDAGRKDPPAQALADFCQALMSSNEFVYVD